VEVEQRPPRGDEHAQLLRVPCTPVDRVQVPADVLGEHAEQHLVHI
jgi:hypothetical protein